VKAAHRDARIKASFPKALMNLAISPQMQRFVDEEVRSGRYAAPEDVIHAALASLIQNRWLETASIDEVEAVLPEFRKKIAEGLADLRDGKMVDGEEFFDRLERDDNDAANRKTA
jgi:antitoxin ParD1/3/4